jgi:DNA topoisomerase I
MARYLLIVESAKKGKEIQKYLGSDWIIESCRGHITDLPPKDLGVDLSSFEEEYVVRGDDYKKVVAKLKKLAHSSQIEHVYLGTDPDREGEVIAWSLARELKLKKGKFSRVAWQEVTKAAILREIERATSLNMSKIDAGRSRRVLDRIVGWRVSGEICWPAGAKAAGRVLTPTLHLLCDREKEIEAFIAETYFTVSLTYEEGLDAFVPGGSWNGAQEEGGADGEGGDGEKKGRLSPKWFRTREEAQEVLDEAGRHAHKVRNIEEKRTTRAAPPAYKTSTLQADAGRKLKLSSDATMKLAQSLYEKGYITYMRTDSERLTATFAEEAIEYIETQYPGIVAENRKKVKAGAQDAHPGIHPTSIGLNTAALPADERQLFDMIFARAMASLCKPAVFNRTTVYIDSGSVEWVALGSVLKEENFLKYWGPYARSEDTILPAVQPGQVLSPEEYDLAEKQTRPPSRYDEPSLVTKMEGLGIGRPSTYAPTLTRLKSHGYVADEDSGKKKYLKPTSEGRTVDALIYASLPDLTSAEYTSAMETELDRIEKTEQSRVEYLRSWYGSFETIMGTALGTAKQYIKDHGLKPQAREGGNREVTDITCHRCGKEALVKIGLKGNKGSFLACTDTECGFTREVKAVVKPGACGRDGCGGTLVERRKRGKGAGSFMACAAKDCRYSENMDGPKPLGRYARSETDRGCPRCEKAKLVQLELREPKEGEAPGFYACADDSCKFTLTIGARKHRVPCDKCGGMMLERWSKKKTKFYGCAKCPNIWSAEGVA